MSCGVDGGIPPPGPADRRGARACIVVFARLPVPGRVKTRLAAGLGVGPSSASDWYRVCAEHALQQVASCCPWAHVFLFHSTADATEDVAAWLAAEGLEGLACLPQLGSAAGSDTDPDLGAKMLAAMAEARRRSGCRKVIITGTDIPDLSAELLQRAADALDEHEAVWGPSLDGGYYLMGLTRLEDRLFTDMRWSTDSVLRETLERARRADPPLRVAPPGTLPPLRDIDTLQP
ncbi:hypothetical protein GPECTOR_65g170 [Gonium pectorale]|uniref:Glycosyltransferase n=1 Tax=Gonium pectorale TaxID=33097 RepID=A0A150G3V2_GONPE|nr:hypothetical protein GPECTOR_65g170 [Gonium pectorale]|eukprot:KXZ44552.1 hypothetical protein GPECTOR_65g170 [Gonium pectorale]